MNERLKQPVTAVKGIGTEAQKALSELDIFTIEDLLMYFPYRYNDYRIRDLREAEHESG